MFKKFWQIYKLKQERKKTKYIIDILWNHSYKESSRCMKKHENYLDFIKEYNPIRDKIHEEIFSKKIKLKELEKKIYSLQHDKIS